LVINDKNAHSADKGLTHNLTWVGPLDTRNDTLRR
jgi:hypothetical protein